MLGFSLGTVTVGVQWSHSEWHEMKTHEIGCLWDILNLGMLYLTAIGGSSAHHGICKISKN